MKWEFTENDCFHVEIIASFNNFVVLYAAENENSSAGCPGEPSEVADDAHSPYSESGLLSCFRPISDRKLHFSLLSR